MCIGASLLFNIDERWILYINASHLTNQFNHNLTTNAMLGHLLITLITSAALVFICIPRSLCVPRLISLTDISNHFLTYAGMKALFLFRPLTYSIFSLPSKIWHLSFLRYDRKCAGVHRINLTRSIFLTETSMLLLLPTKCTISYLY